LVNPDHREQNKEKEHGKYLNACSDKDREKHAALWSSEDIAFNFLPGELI
jgi:hypothetical protein